MLLKHNPQANCEDAVGYCVLRTWEVLGFDNDVSFTGSSVEPFVRTFGR